MKQKQKFLPLRSETAQLLSVRIRSGAEPVLELLHQLLVQIHSGSLSVLCTLSGCFEAFKREKFKGLLFDPF